RLSAAWRRFHRFCRDCRPGDEKPRALSDRLGERKQSFLQASEHAEPRGGSCRKPWWKRPGWLELVVSPNKPSQLRQDRIPMRDSPPPPPPGTRRAPEAEDSLSIVRFDDIHDAGGTGQPTPRAAKPAEPKATDAPPHPVSQDSGKAASFQELDL